MLFLYLTIFMFLDFPSTCFSNFNTNSVVCIHTFENSGPYHFCGTLWKGWAKSYLLGSFSLHRLITFSSFHGLAIDVFLLLCVFLSSMDFFYKFCLIPQT